MGIYIKSIELPTSCRSCPFENGGDCYGGKAKYIKDVDDNEEQFRNSRHPDCPLVYVLEPHGRLADVDVLYKELVKESEYLLNEMENQEKNPNEYVDNFRVYTSYILSGLSSAMISIYNAPTVIEGSE